MSMGSIMAMAWSPLGPGELMGRVMLSAEPLTVGERGYPLLLQSGETVGGETAPRPAASARPVHGSRRELHAAGIVRVRRAVHVAPACEPALGPTAFPHRISAASDPLAPLGHHWQDSTHIAFGVLTASVFTKRPRARRRTLRFRSPAARLTCGSTSRSRLRSRSVASTSEMLGLGYALYFGPFGSFTPALGARASAGYAEPGLDAYYGERVLLGLIAYVQLQPVAMVH